MIYLLHYWYCFSSPSLALAARFAAMILFSHNFKPFTLVIFMLFIHAFHSLSPDATAIYSPASFLSNGFAAHLAWLQLYFTCLSQAIQARASSISAHTAHIHDATGKLLHFHMSLRFRPCLDCGFDSNCFDRGCSCYYQPNFIFFRSYSVRFSPRVCLRNLDIFRFVWYFIIRAL